MGTKTVRLDDQVYKRVRAYKNEDETFSEAIDRLISPSLLDLAGVFDKEQVATLREAVNRSDSNDTRDASELVERFD